MKAINQIIGSIYQNIGDYVFDKKYGLDTVLRVDLSKRSSGNNYQPTGLFRSRKILDRLKKHGNSGLVDFGSGKGQFLLTAASLNFTSVKGIEFVKEIHSIAEKNIATFCSKRSKIDVPISICVDASQYEVVEEDKLFYFFYPFKSETMLAVVENIEKSALKWPRKIVAAMLYPHDADTFKNRSGWTQIEDFKAYGFECRFYSFQSN
jgi:hypothetical protein